MVQLPPTAKSPEKWRRSRVKPGMAAQAVGGAVGHNPISLIIPCHRVIGAGGSLTGYAGGLAQKVWLLRHEGVDLGGMTWPGVGPVK